MDDDRSWLKNPVLPRPAALPRFSPAELSLAEEERESGVLRVARRTEAAVTAERSEQRVSGTSAAKVSSTGRREGPALAPRRSA